MDKMFIIQYLISMAIVSIAIEALIILGNVIYNFLEKIFYKK